MRQKSAGDMTFYQNFQKSSNVAKVLTQFSSGYVCCFGTTTVVVLNTIFEN